MNLKAWSYDLFIDPLLAGLKRSVANKVPAGTSVIDVACGHGSLAMTLAARAGNVTGIDLDSDLIRYATEQAAKLKTDNINFIVHDAASLSEFADRQFDIAVTSMAIHQFDGNTAVAVLREMKRIAVKVIIADYSCPMPPGFPRAVAYSIERMARGNHWRNFRKYMATGGLEFFTKSADLTVLNKTVRGNKVFVIVECQ